MKNRLLAAVLVSIVFWNVENLFEPGSRQMAGKRWSASRYTRKCAGIGKVLLSLSDSLGNPPEIICLSEVQSEKVLRKLVFSDQLRKFGYRFVHYDSPDHREMDCALLYRTVTPLRHSAHHVRDKSGEVLPTRDILLVEFDGLAVLVNHHPSKFGGKSGESRLAALMELHRLCDSLCVEGCRIVALGDLNETRNALNDSLMSPMVELPSDRGTIRFQGRWEQIDRAYVSPGLDASLEVGCPEALLEPDRKFGGVKPWRTYIGPVYHGGLSDHLPISVTIKN